MSVLVEPVDSRSGRRVRGTVVGPRCRPSRPVPARGVAGPVACRDIVRPAVAPVDLVLWVKVVLVTLVALLGLGSAALGFASWGTPDPSVTYVPGDPAWAHVDAWR